MTDPANTDDEKSIRDLLLGVHVKLDAILTSYRRILRDRLKDRDTVQRHDRRIENLEHQVALLTAHSPGMGPWRPNVADQSTSEHTAVQIAEMDLEDETAP